MSIIKEWPILYTLDSKSKVRIFKCRIVEDKVKGELSGFNFIGYDIITSTGLLGGKLIDQKEKVKDGKSKGKKNETTPLSQAMLQADSLWIAKLQEGYKSLELLRQGITTYGKPALNGETLVLKQANEYLNNWWYTNSNWDELPMLAYPVKKVKKLQFPYLAQPKLNGVRCLIGKLLTNKEDKLIGLKMISRGGTYYEISHVRNQMLELFTLLRNNGFDVNNLLFDGELYKHGVPLQEISGASRKEESGLFTSNNWLEYHIYDAVDLSKPNQTQKEREQLRLKIYNIFSSNLFQSCPNIRFVVGSLVEDEESIKSLHDTFVAEGYEGLILRDLSSFYKFNQRSTGLLKVKEFIDEEFEIIGYEIDPNKSVEESFVFVLKNNQGKMTAFGSHPSHTFKARPTGSNSMKMQWFEEMLSEKYVGKMATVRYFERSKDGTPTMGVLKHDLCEFLHIRANGE